MLADVRSFPAVLREDRGDVGVMVLHRDARNPERLGEACGLEVGVKVVRNGDGVGLQDRAEVGDRLLEEAVRLGVVHVADVL